MSLPHGVYNKAKTSSTTWWQQHDIKFIALCRNTHYNLKYMNKLKQGMNLTDTCFSYWFFIWAVRMHLRDVCSAKYLLDFLWDVIIGNCESIETVPVRIQRNTSYLHTVSTCSSIMYGPGTCETSFIGSLHQNFNGNPTFTSRIQNFVHVDTAIKSFSTTTISLLIIKLMMET